MASNPWDDFDFDNVKQNIQSGQSPTGMGQYQKLFDANPYRNLNYNQSGWQKFLSNLGFRTKYDDYVEQAQVNAQEYDAQIYQQMFENEYNSATSVANRERAAGINPDLVGLQGEPAASPAQDPNGMSPSGGEEDFPAQVLSMVGNVSTYVLNLVPKVMSFATSLSQLKGIRLENDAKELDFSDSVLGTVNKFFTEGITENDYRDAFEKNDWTNIIDASKKDASYLADTLFSDKRARRKFKLAFGMRSNSLIGLLQKYKTYDEFEKNRKSLLSQRSSEFFSDDDSTMETLLSGVLNPLERYQKRMNEISERKANLRNPDLEQGLENAQISNQLEYENNIDPSAQAQAENSANLAQAQQNDILEATNQLFSDIMNNLKSNDNWWSKIAMALIGIARAQLLSGIHLQFGRNSNYKVDGNTGVLTEQGSSNFGISF